MNRLEEMIEEAYRWAAERKARILAGEICPRCGKPFGPTHNQRGVKCGTTRPYKPRRKRQVVKNTSGPISD